MNKVVLGAAAAAALTCGFAGTANAQLYAAVSGGWNSFDPTSVSVDNGLAVGTPYSMSLNTSRDFTLAGAVGLRAGQTRWEAEYAHRTGEVTDFNSRGVHRDGDGAVTVDTATVNAYWDFGTTGFVPYLGVGVGAAKAKVEVIGVRPSAPSGGTVTIVDDTNNQFALQAMAGFSAPITSNLLFTAQFRYYDDGTVDMHDTQGHAAHAQIKGNSWEGGLRFTF
ncbi:MAG TPA: outer membrane beta-barrel protein [Hyphomonadaceae bacterium]|nr:outer membrane beta-barrel protein [Hyphomonadaceae bacterium]